MKKLYRILIIGPIGDFGGRELESGFIASVLAEKHEVALCSTGFLTSNSQVFEYSTDFKVVTLQSLIFKEFIAIRILAYLNYIKNGLNKNVVDYVNNLYTKKYFNYKKKSESIIIDLIQDFDVILICAQLSSNYTKLIIEKSKELNKKVIFRTTGTVQSNQNFDYLNKVDLFIHHSESNASRLQIMNHNYVTIDQCAFNENNMLEIPLVNNKVTHFLTLGRLEKEKNINVVIEAFLKFKVQGDVLYVVGDGGELESLKKLAKNEESIIFTGFINSKELFKYFEKIDCVIISSEEESGPLVGVEAMAAGKILISTRVGAMNERIKGICDLWFNGSVECLSNQIVKVKSLNENEVFNLSKSIRERYKNEYSKSKIASKYQQVIYNMSN